MYRWFSIDFPRLSGNLTDIVSENGSSTVDSQMVIFYSYVSSPEGQCRWFWSFFEHLKTYLLEILYPQLGAVQAGHLYTGYSFRSLCGSSFPHFFPVWPCWALAQLLQEMTSHKITGALLVLWGGTQICVGSSCFLAAWILKKIATVGRGWLKIKYPGHRST